jgi:cytochrome c-type biogenesis protein CcmF
MRDATIILGHYGLIVALICAGWSVVASVLSGITRARGLQVSAERAVWVASGLTSVATLCLVSGFLANDFRLDAVYYYSNTSQAVQYKIGALWGGQAGSLLLWALILCVLSSICLWTNRNRHRGLMPWVTAVLGLTITFFMVLLTFIESPFKLGPFRPDGVGLNPQLKNYWMMIHPPALYLGYVGFTVPFAFAIAALATRRTGDLWFRTTRRWTLFSWFFLGLGILLGSYWAYIELGWGGYWAWDPVENASLMPWLTGTAFLHSVMIQEKKGMMKVWNMLLIILTFSLAIFGTFLTRSGVISSVHAFATSDIGPAFGIFLFIIFFSSVILLITRIDTLKSEARLESVLSRESSFLFNNMIFVGIAATVLLLTTFPMLSEMATGQKVTMGPPIFNLVNIPWAIALLLLTGIGPLIAWRKATASNLKRNFLMPGLIGLWTLVALVFLDLREYGAAIGGVFGAIGSLDVVGALDEVKAFYPALVFAIGAFVTATVVLEFHRGVRVRRHNRGEGFSLALSRMVWRNKRRWGGYVVHIGMVVIFIGIAASSAYQKEVVRTMNPGDMVAADDYYMRYEGHRLEAADDHISTITEMTVFDRRSGKLLATLYPEQRFHPNMLFEDVRNAFLTAKERGASGADDYQESVARVYQVIRIIEEQARREVKTPSTEVAILSSISPLAPSRLGEDFYVTPLFVDPTTGQANFRVFINPMVNFIWIGGLIFMIGAHLSVLPDSLERKRLEGAMALEERAVA